MPKDEDRIFDVSKPHRTPASPTARPVIVGHHPMVSDPMVNDGDNDDKKDEKEPEDIQPAGPKSIPILGGDDDSQKISTHAPDVPAPVTAPEPPAAPSAPTPAPVPPIAADHPESVAAAAANPALSTGPTAESAAAAASPAGELHLESLDDVIGHDGPHHHHHLPAPSVESPKLAHHQNPKSRSNKMGLWILIALIVLIGAYLAVDALTNVNLPFQVFKKATPMATTTPPAQTSSKTNSTTTTPDPYAGWQTHSDDFLSFKYPSIWTAVRNDDSSQAGTKSLTVYGPNDSALGTSTAVAKGHKASLSVTFFKGTSAINPCTCKIYDLMTLSLTQDKAAKLLITSDIKPGGNAATPAMYMVASDDTKAVLNATSFNNEFTANNADMELTATVNDNDVPGVQISNVKSFEQTQSVKDLVKIINSVQIK